MNAYLIYGIGLIAQTLFTARLLIQWIASERAKRVLSPIIYWKLSLLASFLLCIYGWLRNDFAIVIGQMISYYIYIWNLKQQNVWIEFSYAIQKLFLFTPIIGIIWGGFYWQETWIRLFDQADIPLGLLLFGTLGQCTFTLRFIYQWWYSQKMGISALPIFFWIISLCGSGMIIIYALIRRDPILILGQIGGFVVYIRNIVIGIKSAKIE